MKIKYLFLLSLVGLLLSACSRKPDFTINGKDILSVEEIGQKTFSLTDQKAAFQYKSGSPLNLVATGGSGKDYKWYLGSAVIGTKSTLATQFSRKNGQLNIKLCKGATKENCTEKLINLYGYVKPQTIDPPPNPVKAPVYSFNIKIPRSATQGDRVAIVDQSTVENARIERRAWTIDGEKLTSKKVKISHVFNKTGPIKVQLCLNGKEACETKVIRIVSKPNTSVLADKGGTPSKTKPAVKPPTPSSKKPPIATPKPKPKEIDRCAARYFRANRRDIGAGLLSNDFTNCSSPTASGQVVIELKPKKIMQLKSAYVFTNNGGKIAMSIKEKGGSKVGDFTYTVTYDDEGFFKNHLALDQLQDVVLCAGKTYQLYLKGIENITNKIPEMANITGCQPSALSSDLDIDYLGNYVLFDLKYDVE